jgi:hypothetical protein
MRIVGWPEVCDADGAIFPVDLMDVDFHGTPQELREIAEFLFRAATELQSAEKRNLALNIGVDLANSNPHAEVGIWVNVVRHVDE